MHDRERLRRIFLGTDLAALGFAGAPFPESEYDTEVDRALSWLMKGRSPTEVGTQVALLMSGTGKFP